MFAKNISALVPTVTAILSGSKWSVLRLRIVLQDAMGSIFWGLSRIQRVYVDAIKYHMRGTFFQLTRDLHTLSRAEVQKSRLQFSVIKGDED